MKGTSVKRRFKQFTVSELAQLEQAMSPVRDTIPKAPLGVDVERLYQLRRDFLTEITDERYSRTQARRKRMGRKRSLRAWCYDRQQARETKRIVRMWADVRAAKTASSR